MGYRLSVSKYCVLEIYSPETGWDKLGYIPVLSKDPESITENSLIFEGESGLINGDGEGIIYYGISDLSVLRQVTGVNFRGLYTNQKIRVSGADHTTDYVKTPMYGFIKPGVSGAVGHTMFFSLLNPTGESGSITIPNFKNSIEVSADGSTSLTQDLDYAAGMFYFVVGDAGYVHSGCINIITVGEEIRGITSSVISDTSRFAMPGGDIDTGTAYGILAGNFVKWDPSRPPEWNKPDPGTTEGDGFTGGLSGSRYPYQYPSGGTGQYEDDDLEDRDGTDDNFGVGKPVKIGGGGTHKLWGDGSGLSNIDLSATLDPVKTGLLNIYRTNISGLTDFLSKLWTQNFIDNVAKFFNGNADQAVLKIYKTKFQPTIMPSQRDVYLGSWDTGLRMDVCNTYKKGVLASFSSVEFFGSFLDYQTNLYLWLPFYGFAQLDPEKYMSTKRENVVVTIGYCANFLTGMLVYNIEGATVDGDGNRKKRTILDTFTCSMNEDIPISQNSMNNIVSGITQMTATAAGIAATVLSGGTLAPVAVAGAVVGGATSGLSMMKRSFGVAGNSSGNAGFLQSPVPYILAIRPVQYEAYNRPHFLGKLSRQTVKIGALQDNSFVKVENAVMSGSIPEDAKSNILDQLKNGVYI